MLFSGLHVFLTIRNGLHRFLFYFHNPVVNIFSFDLVTNKLFIADLVFIYLLDFSDEQTLLFMTSTFVSINLISVSIFSQKNIITVALISSFRFVFGLSLY